MSWTIKGETGKTLDATARSLEALNISTAVLRFQSLAVDTLTWQAETADATGTGTIVPDLGQIVEIWKDSARKFRGHVTGVRVGMKSISVTVSGPWWWLERINLTSDVLPYTGATSGSAERPTYVFPTQSLTTSLDALIARAITNGAPMVAGTVATMFSVPKITLAEQNCAEALATLLAWCPDAVAWFDYSGSAAPILNIYRRDTTEATALTITIGTDAVEDVDIKARLDLEVARNELHFVVRNATTGRPEWATQASGTDAAGKRQIVTVSGPEIATLLPKDDFDSMLIRTAEVGGYAAEIDELDPVIAAVIAAYGPVGWTFNAADYGLFPNCPQRNGGMPGSGAHRVILGSVPEWMKTSGVMIAGSPVKIVESMTRVSGWLYNTYSGSYSAAVTALKAQGRAFSAASGGNYQFCVYIDYTVPTINVSWPTAGGTTVYKAWDYDYLTPPAGLAAALVAAQNWVPWEGPLTLVGDDVTGDNLLARKYHLAGTLTPCATMGALARSITHDILRGRTTIDLGAPARLDFGTLVSRVRSDPKDNIVYL